MNKHAHRLVFDTRRGMRVPTHEHCHAAGKAAGGQSRAVVLTGALGALMLAIAPQAAQAQSSDGTRAGGAVGGTAVTRSDAALALPPAARSVSSLVQDALKVTGRAALPVYTPDGLWANNKGDYQDPMLSDDGKVMSVVLTGKTAILNWDSFNLGAGYTLRFENNTGSVNNVLNISHDASAALLDGNLFAPNTNFMLQSTAGVIFGQNFRANTGSLVATALKLSDDVFQKGIRSFRNGEAVFGGNENDSNGFVSVQRGAEIRALAGGDVILVAPRVVNEGLIETPQGQTILAAGKTVYLYAPLDLAQRGLLVAVDNFSDETLASITAQADQVIADGGMDAAERPEPLGTVENAATGQVRADKGTINLVGAAIRQKGHLTATTAVKGENGAIYLMAMTDTALMTPAKDGTAAVRIANKTGTIELADGSVTEVLPSIDGLSLTDAEKQAVAEALSQPDTDTAKVLSNLRKPELNNLTAVAIGQLLTQFTESEAKQPELRAKLDQLASETLKKISADNLAAINEQLNRAPNDSLKDAFKTDAASSTLDLSVKTDRDKLTEVALASLTRQAIGGLGKSEVEVLTLTALQNLSVADKTHFNDVALSPVLKTLGKIGVGPSELRHVVDKPTELGALAASATAAEKLKYAVDKQNYDTHLALYEDALQQTSDTFFRSRIDLIGKDISLQSGATVQTSGGEVNMFATSNWNNSPLRSASAAPALDTATNTALSDGSSLVMEAGARIDVSGLDNLRLPASRNQLQGRLFSIELSDSPLQRDGVVYRQELFADARRAITIGDASGLYDNIRYSAAEYSTAGGLLRMQSQGRMLVADDAEIDFSGGKLTYDAGTLLSSVLFRNGAITRIEDANRNVSYDALVSDPSRTSEEVLLRQGLDKLGSTAAKTLPEQVVGMSAGAALLSAPVMYVSPSAKVDGSVVMSDLQRLSSTEAGRSSGQLNPNSSTQSLEDLLVTYEKLDATNPTFESLGDKFHVVNRPFALIDAPYLYASLKPTAGYLQLGQAYTSPAYNALSSIVVSANAQPVPQDWLGQAAANFSISAQTINDAHLGALSLKAYSVKIGAPATNEAAADHPEIRLTAGGKFSASSSQDTTMHANITVPGGTIALTSTDLGNVLVTSGSRLDVAGTVLDERFTDVPVATVDEATGIELFNDSMARAGGKVMLVSPNNITLESGSEVDVSGSTWVNQAGTLVQGQAGAVELTVNAKGASSGGQLKLDATLSAFDASKGGSLKLKNLPAVIVGDQEEGLFSLDSNLYADRGFGKLEVTTLGNITIASDTKIAPALVNKVATALRVGIDGKAEQPYELAQLEAWRRQPFVLSLSAASVAPAGNVKATELSQFSTINVGSGALIDVGLGGSISMAADGRIDIAGTLQALGGQVNLALLGGRGSSSSSDLETTGYIPNQQIHLADGSLIDVSGAVKSHQVAGFTGLAATEVGEVLAGGTITLGGPDGTATRGQLIMDPTAKLRLNGASGMLDQPKVAGKQSVSAAAGTLNIMSTDGFQLLGEVQAQAPNASVAGGTLNMSLSQESKGDLIEAGANPYPTDEAAGKRSIRITAGQAGAQELAADGLKFGEAVVSSSLFNSSGFDSIAMRADESVQFNAGSHIKAAEDRGRLQSVVLNTSVLDVTDGASHVIQAHHVAFGPSAKLGSDRPAALPQVVAASQRAADGALGGEGGLTVQAGLIEVAGDTAVLGVNKLALDATLAANRLTAFNRRNGEIRFLGQSTSASKDLNGQLSFTGQLSLKAGQVYASTLSNYTLTGYNSNGLSGGGELLLSAPDSGSTSLTPLSALASLSMKADTIVLDGNVSQPIGTLAIQANTLTVGSHAHLSVSADGTKVPVGATLNQSQWVYNTQGVVDPSGAPLDLQLRTPSSDATATVLDLTELPLNKQIALNGGSLELSEAAVADAGAGGDILAWEFKSGVGGSTDTYLRQGVFAILPSYGYDFAPFDTEIRNTTKKIGTQLQAGDQVRITTDNGVLSAGTYTLMDARYGILPGAVLVSASTQSLTTPLRTGVKYDDGSVLVSGNLSRTGTQQNGGRDQGIALILEPQATAAKKSEVLLTSGNAYQAKKAQINGTSLALPGDAGRISLESTKAFDWAASFDLSGQADQGFRAGQFDLSMPDMVVQADATQAKPEGFETAMSVSLEQLNALGADSVLLGGKRTTLSDGSIMVERVANSISFQAEVDANGGLVSGNTNKLSTQGELLAVAKDAIVVDNGLTIESTGIDTGDKRQYVLQGNGAALEVGNLAATDISVRVGQADADEGSLSVGRNDAAGAVQLRGHSVQLDATASLAVATSTEVDALTLSLGGQRLALGAPVGSLLEANTVEISGNLLAAVSRAENLKLRAYSSIDLYGSIALGSDSLTVLTLDGPALRGIGESGDTVVLQAREVTLTNTSSRQAAASSESSASSLVVTARPVLQDGRTGGLTVGGSLADGQATGSNTGMRLAFDSTTLESTGDIVLDGSGKLQAEGDLTLRAARVTATSGTDQTLDAAGVLRIERAEGGKSLGESVGIAGKLVLQGQRIEQSGNIDIESGKLQLIGRGTSEPANTVVFGEGSVTRVDGRLHQQSDTYAVASTGGHIVAQAQSGQIVVDGLLSAAAPVMPEGVNGENPEAGSISLSSFGANGGVTLGIHGQINLDAANGKAGTLRVDARQLALNEAARNAAAANSQAAQSGLDKLMVISSNASSYALREVKVRVRELDVKLNTTVKAATVTLTADGGKLDLGASAIIDATVPQGGVVQLNALGDLSLQSGSQVLAQSTRQGANGGDVLLSSSEGSVLLGDTKVLAGSADDVLDGRIVVRALQTQDAFGNYTGGMNVARLPDGSSEPASQAILQAGRIELEGVRVYDDVARTSLNTGNSTSSAWGLSSLQQDAQAFATTENQQAILTTMGLADRAEASVRAGAEIRSAADLSVASDMQLNSVRAGGQPLNLTLRAVGDLAVNGSVSDGFSTATTTGLIQEGNAASLRFVAGADLSSADVNATQADASQGHFTLDSKKLIRTTTGSIDVHASGDVRLMAATSSTPSAIYVAGGLSKLQQDERFAVDATDIATTRANTAYKNAVFTERGERLAVSAGGEVGSFASIGIDANGGIERTQQLLTQLTGNYFYHGGNPNASVASRQAPVAWWSGVNQFLQGFGSFGGGDISVTAGGSVSNVAVVAPTNARQLLNLDSNGEVASSHLKVLNGGDVNVSAGGNIVGGVYFLGRGEGRLNAEGALTRGADVLNGRIPSINEVSEPGAMLALMSGHWTVNTVGDLNVSHLYNPTVVPFRFTGQGSFIGTTGGSTAASGLNANSAAIYYTYDSDASVAVNSLAGNVIWAPNAQNFNRMHANSAVESLELTAEDSKNASVPASVIPPVVNVTSLLGDVTIDTGGRPISTNTSGSNGLGGSSLYVMPSAESDIKIFAGQDLHMQAKLQVLDRQQVNLGLPDAATPVLFNGSSSTPASFQNLILSLKSDAPGISFNLQDKGAPIFDAGQSQNDKPVRLYAGRDVLFDTVNQLTLATTSFLRSARPLEVIAGRDLIDPNILGQNFAGDDVTLVSAGRDIIGSDNVNLQRALALGGPGQFKIQAGRDIDLNQMLGVLAVGQQINSALPEASAKIILSAGNAKAVNITALIRQYGNEPQLRATMNQALLDSALPLPDGFASWADVPSDQVVIAFSKLKQAHQVASVQGYLDQAFAALYLPDEVGKTAEYYRSEAFKRLKQEALWQLIIGKAGEAVKIAVSSDPDEEAKRKLQRQALFAEASQALDMAGLGGSFSRTGSINLVNSKVHNEGQGGGLVSGRVDDGLGGIDVMAADQVTLGLPSTALDPHGFINFNGGSFRAITGGNFLAGDQKAVVVGRGNLYIYAADGDIDAGQGSNTATAKPLPTPRFDQTSGQVVKVGQPPTGGAGFQAVESPADVETRVGLYAPNGEIRALDAFIKGGKVEIVAPTVLGADNIANASGVPAPPPPAVNLTLPSKPADTSAGAARAADASGGAASKAQANSQLTVELLGFGGESGASGEDPCVPNSNTGKCRNP